MEGSNPNIPEFCGVDAYDGAGYSRIHMSGQELGTPRSGIQPWQASQIFVLHNQGILLNSGNLHGQPGEQSRQGMMCDAVPSIPHWAVSIQVARVNTKSMNYSVRGLAY